MSTWRELAPAKVNLCLFLGPGRDDGRHELVTLFESISLADELRLLTLQEGPDEVGCPGVAGPNLVSSALEALRRVGWAGPPVHIEIDKRIPVAAGLGGGSADAAAALRLAHALEPVPEGAAPRIARQLGSDVPSQLQPGLSLGTGAGEVVEPLRPLAPHALVIVPQPFGLSTAEVYREADRLRLPRSAAELEALRQELLSAAAPGAELPPQLVVNDLEPAALSLAPHIAAALDAIREAGADRALVCGSGPTAAGLWWGERSSQRAHQAAQQLAGAHPGAVAAVPVTRVGASPSCGTIAGGP